MFKIYIRWNVDGDEGYHKVDLTLGGEVVQTSGIICNNPDRVYGYCRGTVDTLKRLGVEIEMPRCLTNRHLCADMSRED